MEEILASIRRIIADDQAFPAARTAPAAETAPVVPHESQAPPAAEETAPLRAEVPHLAPEVVEPEPIEHVESESAFAASVGPSVVAPLSAQEEPPHDGQANEGTANEDMVISLHAAASFDPPEASPSLRGSSDPLGASGLEERYTPPSRPAASEPRSRAEEGAPLVSPETDAAVGTAFNALVTSHFLQNSDVLAQAARDMLRPMLKAWLDDNLPIMVERMVRAEIERVARGGR